ncbi:MAG: toxin-antitoxin system TumE family protein [Metallibacterium sp.]
MPLPVGGSHHLLKYSLYYGRGGGRIVGYDNEPGKGDHRHLRDVGMPYTFTTVEQLMVDFSADVQRERGQQP